jgi:hypothetical protein
MTKLLLFMYLFERKFLASQKRLQRNNFCDIIPVTQSLEYHTANESPLFYFPPRKFSQR